ncbi:MAG: heme-copper oxidase subunit III [Anaerolineae bacterium]|nr:heme-copper oxidase subunit III [Ardenticatenia bacterium]HRA20630.1 cytochrome c oxidase subunit 3 [Anaerolineae bacterium]
MASQSGAQAHSHPATHDHGHHSVFHYDHLALNRLGLWLFFISETMIFLVLLSTRFVLPGARQMLDANGGVAHVDQVLGLVITVILLASSLTAYRAETAIAHGDRKTCERNLMGTIIMGTIFLLAVVVLEWPTALEHHVTPHAGFGISLFAMTGMHAFHVLSGVVILLLVWANLRKGGYSAEHHWGVEATVKYWHMVDLVWVFFYPVLYLLGPIK